ncbi:hypothetical protein CONPUDRAFT_54452, partial [Coniophora puteana RWD-64-598 SS2]
YLQEMIRLEGRGSHMHDKECPRCQSPDPRYRCVDCHGGILYCEGCMVEKHNEAPLHRIKVWNGTFFEPKSLKAMGLRVQLGHPPGVHCNNPKQAYADDFVVIDTHGVHQVGVDFCQCETTHNDYQQLLRAEWFPASVSDPKTAATFRVLESFHLLSLESKSSAYEFYRSISRATDNLGILEKKDRYDNFLVMVRQWRHLKMLKRTGRGHVSEDLEETPEGACAVQCPACPHPEKNLPDGWQSAPPHKQWLYGLFLAIDANFRLKRKAVSREELDPSFGDGWAYFVKEQPFQDWLASQPDPPHARSSCSNHKAVNMANTKFARGLAVTGVGTVDCARHNMKLPCGVGNLIAGERYNVMDYILFSTLRWAQLRVFKISYDICCQWFKNLWARAAKLPEHLAFSPFGRIFHFLVPKFHLPAHILSCRTRFSFNFTPGVGRTDGEAPERGWANINPVASSTKEMGPGHRKDTLNDFFGDWNWKKTTGLGLELNRKLSVAFVKRADHQEDFMDMERTLPQPRLVEWRKDVEAWENGQTEPNPFESRVQKPTQLSVRLELAKREAKELAKGMPITHSEITRGVLIAAGIDIEDLQRRLRAERRSVGQNAVDHQVKVQNRANTLQIRIENWTKAQVLHMPSVVMLRSSRHTSSKPVNPESITLFLPSQLPPRATCDLKLREIEWDLRVSQAHDALSDLRQTLQYRYYLYKDKDRNSRGQGANTRALNIIESVNSKIKGYQDTYRDAYGALLLLKPILRKHSLPSELRALRDADVRAMPEELDGETEGKRRISWIWLALPLDPYDENDPVLIDTIRVEWCKARARAMRWTEEVELLVEEMRRTIAFFKWQTEWWVSYSDRKTLAAPEDEEGSRAYALRQANSRRALALSFTSKWTKSLAVIHGHNSTSKEAHC